MARTGAEVVWIPVFLAGIMKATGNQPPAMVPARGIYLSADSDRWAAFYGVPFRLSPHFPLNTLTAMRVACAFAADRPERYRAFVTACFRAAWVDGIDLNDRAALTSLVAADDRAFVTEAMDAPQYKEALKKNTEEAVAAGAFGVPSFVIGKEELFFGNDRIDLLAWRLTKGTAAR
ncbi:MAG: 2-hydroxychromene-2-carboxylate isomerase [Minicystis sp.]